jgi:hypothetical protein
MLWTWVKLACSVNALIAFAIRLSEEDEQEHPNQVLRASLTELISFEGNQVRKDVQELCQKT